MAGASREEKCVRASVSGKVTVLEVKAEKLKQRGRDGMPRSGGRGGKRGVCGETLSINRHAFKVRPEMKILKGEELYPNEKNEPQINATEHIEMDEHFNSGTESNGH